jgi:RNA recognition motif-containing protein
VCRSGKCNIYHIPLDVVLITYVSHAFVHFRSREEANEAMTQFNGYELEGRRLTIEWCIPQGVQRNQKKSPKPVNYGMPYPPMQHHHNAPYAGYFYGYPPPGPAPWPARANTHAHGAMPPHHMTPRPAQGMEHHHKAPANYQGYDYWPSYGKPPTDRERGGGAA